MAKFIAETLRTPVIAETDVVVLGGGPAGVCAAVAAARLGAQVTLVERWGHLGGQATGGLVIEFFGASDGPAFQWGRKIKGGIYEELVDRLKPFEAVTRYPDVLIHPEYLKLVCQQMLFEAGVKQLTHTLAVGAALDGDRIKAALIENKSGRGAILGRVFVDGTGDGDSADWCGVPYELLPADQLRPVTLVYRFGNVNIERARTYMENDRQAYADIMAQAKAALGFPLCWNPTMNAGEVWTDEAHLNGIDCSKAEDMIKCENWGREKAAAAFAFYRKHVPGFEAATWVDTAPQMGTRESRRIRGKYWVTDEDCKAGRNFDDCVVLNLYHPAGPGNVFGIPYRSLLPSVGPKNLIFSGRSASVSHDIMDWMREIPSCACLGQAAGTGAALALNRGGDVSAVETPALRKALLDAGAILEV